MGYFMLGAGPTALQGHSQRAWAFWEVCALCHPATKRAWCMQTAFFIPEVIQCFCQQPSHRDSKDRAEVKERVGVGTWLECPSYCPPGAK